MRAVAWRLRLHAGVSDCTRLHRQPRQPDLRRHERDHEGTDREDAVMLERLDHWARTTPERTYLIQPLPDGAVVEYTWARVRDEARRMAAHLHSLGLPAGSSIAIYGKNRAPWVLEG